MHLNLLNSYYLTESLNRMPPIATNQQNISGITPFGANALLLRAGFAVTKAA